MLKAWERRVVGINNYDDPELHELAGRFDEDFTRVFKAAGKDERCMLLNMLHTMSELHNKEAVRMFEAGLRCGYEGGLQYLLEQEDVSGQLQFDMLHTA